jgi:hypothetical protein
MMAHLEPDFWQRAEQAREKLVLQLYGQTEVSLIDLGFDPKDPTGTGPIYLRVHLRQIADINKLLLPADIDGIPVIAIVADYRLE